MAKALDALLAPDEFKAALEYMMPYTKPMEDIGRLYFVNGLPILAVVARVGCTRQYVVRIITRFAQAHGRYVQAWKNENEPVEEPRSKLKKL